jgi:flagellar M-ring protein FliF
LTRRQQIQLVGVTASLLLVLILFLFFTLRTQWVTLYSNQDYAHIHQAHIALEAEGIRNRPNSAWTAIDVPARDVTAARGAVFQHAGAAASRMTLENALDIAGLGTTEAQNAALLLAAFETGLEETLISMDGIVDARVEVVHADRNLLMRPNQPPAQMSVLLTTTRNFSSVEGRNLAELLRTTVRGLELENITIIDQRANAIFMGAMMPENDSAMDVANMRARQEIQLIEAIRGAFLHIFDDVSVIQNINYDPFIDREERIISVTAPTGTEDGLPTFRQIERQEAEGLLGVPWAPGLGSNMQASPAYMMGDPALARASSLHRTESFVHDVHETYVRIGPGGMDADYSFIGITLTRITNICEADWRERNPNGTREEWLAVKDANSAFIVEFDTEEAASIRTFIATSTGIPFTNVAVMLQEVFNIIEIEETPLPIATIIMLAVLLLLIAMLLFAVLARRKEEEEELEPELSVEDLLATTQLEEAKDEAERLKEIEYDQDNEIKKQIDKFVNEKPEAVAALLRNWLNAEEW